MGMIYLSTFPHINEPYVGKYIVGPMDAMGMNIQQFQRISTGIGSAIPTSHVLFRCFPGPMDVMGSTLNLFQAPVLRDIAASALLAMRFSARVSRVKDGVKSK